MNQYPHRLVAAALALGLTLAACGGDDRITGETASPNVEVMTGPTLSTEPLDFGAMIAPVPIDIVGTDGSANGASESMSNGGIVAMPDTKLVFEFAEGLELPTANIGYLYRGQQPVDQAALQVVASALGIDPASAVNWDDVVEQPNVSPTTAPNEAVPSLGYSAADSYQTWSYSDPKVMGNLTTCDPGQPISPSAPDPAQSVLPTDQGDVLSETNPDLSASPGPTIPYGDDVCGSSDAAPEGVPSEAEVRQLGTDLLSKLGVDVSHLELEVFADPYSASIVATEKSGEGIATGRSWTINYGAGAAVSFAQGPLAVPQPVGEYPLVDMSVAQARLRNSRSGLIPVDGEPIGGSVTVESIAPIGSGEIPPPDSAPPLEERVVNLVDVEPDAIFVWDSEDNTWGIPAFRFVDADGNPWTVPAIPDDLMPNSNEPGTGGDPGGSVPSPAATSPADIGPGATTEPGMGDVAIDTSSLEPLVGTATVAEFEAAAQAIGADVRVVRIGAEDLIVTEDYSLSRINIAVDSSSPDDVSQAIVTAIVSVG